MNRFPLLITASCALVVLCIAQMPENDAIWQYSQNYYDAASEVPTPDQLVSGLQGPIHPSLWDNIVGTTTPILALFHDPSNHKSKRLLKRMKNLIGGGGELDETNQIGLLYIDAKEWTEWAHAQNYLLQDESYALLYFPTDSKYGQPFDNQADIEEKEDGQVVLNNWFQATNAEIEKELGPRVPGHVWTRINTILEQRQTKQVYALINEYPHIVRGANADGLGLLHLAAHYDLPKLMKKSVKLIKEYGEKTGHDFLAFSANKKDRFERTPLHIAAQRASPRNVKHLIKAGADVNALNFEGETPTYVALMSWMSHQRRRHGAPKAQHNRCIELLLKAGAEVDPEARDNARFFHLAIRGRNIPLVRMLLERGVDINARSQHSSKWTALHFAADESEFQVIVSKHILTKGLKLPPQLSGNTDSLEGWGFDLHPRVLKGYDRMYNRSVFDLEMSKGFQAMTQLLLDVPGIDVNGKDEYDATPLHLIAYHGDVGVAKQLIKAGAQVNVRDRHGLSPLFLAATRNYVPMVRYLLEQGANKSDIADVKFYGDWQEGEYDDGIRYHRPVPVERRKPYVKKVNPRTADGGGWNNKEKAEVDINFCDLERRSNLTVGEFVKEYLLPGKPVVITDACEHWPAFELWRKESFREKFADARFKIMTDKNGRPHSLDQTGSEYLKWLDKHSGERFPHYLFDGAFEDPYPEILEDVGRIPHSGQSNLKLRQDYFNMFQYFTYQLVVGPAFAGANPHFHHTTWNTLLFGRKRWMIWPPAQSFYSSKHPHRWFDEDWERVQKENQPLECIQESGDLFFLPDMWGHAVVNLNDAVAIAESTFFGWDSFSGVSAPV
eukprot:TRINITY_DN11006_c0_g1_i1.p1 TRINITY_DN11006_c0_g1~~TRINITY_DN11006_c0_g1_i1.p1  ORF type:complete len:837 (-),score=179.23 TRINITY_DN11006_c0_g1_i1:965-3475(-)